MAEVPPAAEVLPINATVDTKIGRKSRKGELKFLTFTDFSQTIKPETKKKVRSHVQSQIQKRLRNERQKNKEKSKYIDLDISSLSQKTHNNTMVTFPDPHGLGAGQSDPFTSYPIDMDVRTHELFDHLHGKTCPLFQTLSWFGFYKMVTDGAGFRQILCTASAHMTCLRMLKGSENNEARQLSAKAFRTLNTRMADPVARISDGNILTILAFASHTVMFNDGEASNAHLNGVQEILRHRGGLQALRNSDIFWRLLYWLDVNTAFLNDTVPQFPNPDGLVPQIRAQPLILPKNQVLLDTCVTEDMASAIDELLVWNQYVVRESVFRNVWKDGPVGGFYPMPALSKLLKARNEVVAPDLNLLRQESCRIASLLYLAAARQRFGVNVSLEKYVTKLKNAILAQHSIFSDTNDSLLLWEVFVGGVQSTEYAEQRWFIASAAQLILARRLAAWEDLMVSMREILWIDGILDKNCGLFRREVTAELNNVWGHVFS